MSSLSLDDELKQFYQRSGFGDVPGKRPLLVPVYTGCILVPLPNIETRRVFLKYHDLHHLVTGYSVGRIGEGEVSAWELGTGSLFVSPVLGLMNFIALSTGMFLKPERMKKAFRRGCRSRNLYPLAARQAVDNGQFKDLSELCRAVLEVDHDKDPGLLRWIEFWFYVACSMVIHACLAIPAVIVRFVTDTVCGKSIFKACVPKKRTDLF